MTNTYQIPVSGMSCAACAGSVESVLKASPGVLKAEVNYASEKVNLKIDPEKTNLALLKKQVEAIGYQLLIDTEDGNNNAEQRKEDAYRKTKRDTLLAGLFSLPLFIVGMFFMDMPYAGYIMLLLATPILFVFGKRFFINAWKQAKNGRVNMDTLVAISTGTAYVFSLFNTFFPAYFHANGLHGHVYYEASGIVIFFILAGKLLEEKAKSGTSAAIKRLMGMQPKTVTAIRNGEELQIPIKEVVSGDLIIVKPGERIPVDGKVKSGESYIDESSISGEPIPVLKVKKSNVYAGTLNQQGGLRILAERVGADTYLSQIIRLVEEAQGSKAPVQKLVDKIAAVFVPIVLGISILTFIVWMLSGMENKIAYALISSLSVLVIACPCALGLATPTAIMVGIGKGAENGILIKDARALELLHSITDLILDKTGTITEGKPTVTDYHVFQEQPQLASIIKSLEAASEHPLAQAVVRYFENTPQVSISGFVSVTGQGVQGNFGEQTFYIGKPDWIYGIITHPQEASVKKRVTELLNQGKTVILTANSQDILGVIAITDQIKEGSPEAVKMLMADGIRIHMLTGDSVQTAETVARQIGIASFRGGYMPEEKNNYLKELQKTGAVVAMAGDGINDSISLASADIGLAMGSGADIALDVAQVAIISNDLRKIPEAIELSKATVRTIRQNLFWAFIYNIIGIPLAAGLLYPVNGFLMNPMIAGAAMAFSSVSVVLNSLRLKMKN